MNSTSKTGKLYVVGLGPGNEGGMTIRARRILDECRIIVGYKTYIDLVKSILNAYITDINSDSSSYPDKTVTYNINCEDSKRNIPDINDIIGNEDNTDNAGSKDKVTVSSDNGNDSIYKGIGISAKVKKYIETGMRQEAERCRLALGTASDAGEPVCMVCSGDSGIYGMAGIILELAPKYPDVEVEVIPGVTAALSGSALLGAAVGHDCAIISLSDLLTPAEVIEKRLRAAAEGDFVLCLYNPASRTRTDHLKRACEILLSYKDKDTVCGCVRNIGRDGESISVMTLDELKDVQADMFTTVFIGNSMTKNIDGYMVTPRGYKTADSPS
ncbi:MAG: precorrin-3B C(17)-methyltransferase [Lachnospiraceae bacterium]|nr:precorrin-3B C(17)-methyltransferase [Lachnospiraceae bacterium]